MDKGDRDTLLNSAVIDQEGVASLEGSSLDFSIPLWASVIIVIVVFSLGVGLYQAHKTKSKEDSSGQDSKES